MKRKKPYERRKAIMKGKKNVIRKKKIYSEFIAVKL